MLLLNAQSALAGWHLYIYTRKAFTTEEKLIKQYHNIGTDRFETGEIILEHNSTFECIVEKSKENQRWFSCRIINKEDKFEKQSEQSMSCSDEQATIDIHDVYQYGKAVLACSS